MMTTTSTYAAIAMLSAGLMGPIGAHADETTVIKEKPGSYSETHQGSDGDYKYKENGGKSASVYEGHGVQQKKTSDGVTTKEVYQDKNCQQKSVDNAATGESKTVSKGDCAN